MTIHPRVIERTILEDFKGQALNISSLSILDIIKIIQADYRMEVRLVIHKHIKNEKERQNKDWTIPTDRGEK